MRFIPGSRTAYQAALDYIRLSDQIRELSQFRLFVSDGLLRALREADADLTTALKPTEVTR